MNNIKKQERANEALGLFMFESSIDDFIEYLILKKEEGKTRIEVNNEGFREETDYVLIFK